VGVFFMKGCEFVFFILNSQQKWITKRNYIIDRFQSFSNANAKACSRFSFPPSA
jgi:hypothetical protein